MMLLPMPQPAWRQKALEVLDKHTVGLKKDPLLGPTVKRVGPVRLNHAPSPFHSLVRAITSQQVSVKAAESIYGRLLEKAGGEKNLKPETLLALSVEEIRSCGYSGMKTSYLRDLSEHALDGRLPLGKLYKLEDEEVSDRLVAVKGIGIWSAQMFLMFYLARPDVWPTGDLGLREALGRIHQQPRPSPKESEALGDKWQGKRSVACWYLWRSLEGNPKEEVAIW